MKKVLAVTALLVSCAAIAYGDDLNTTAWKSPTSGAFTLGAATGGTKKLEVKPSANVMMAYMGGDAGTVYTLGTGHSSGSKLFGSSSLETNIYFFDNVVALGTDLTKGTWTSQTIPSATGLKAGAFGAGWTASK
jgi:hypothetical protein